MHSDNQTGTAAGQSIPIPYDIPTSARAYGWMLGGKDNYEVDRSFLLSTLPSFPECVDIARQNREFLFRVVRYLTREAGIRQFIDMGCGLPTDNNVHQVARSFAPDARVVYVDIDPIVLAHGRALLADDDSTTVITGDMRDQKAILDHPDLVRSSTSTSRSPCSSSPWGTTSPTPTDRPASCGPPSSGPRPAASSASRRSSRTIPYGVPP